MLDPVMSGTAVGLDIGRTNVRAALVDRGGNVLKALREPTDPSGSREAVLGQAVRMAREVGEGASAVGAGVAGQCGSSGIVARGPDFWWEDVDLKAELEKGTGLRAVARNDVIMATVGEWRHGAGRGARDMVCVMVGTGIGGGAVVDGRLATGRSGYAGHFGHVLVDPSGPECSCGRRGCVEALAGGKRVAMRARMVMGSGDGRAAILRRMCGGDPERIDARMVARAAAEGDEACLELRDSMASALIRGTASIVNSFDPEVVVMGGPVLTGFPKLWEMVRDGLRDEVLPPLRPFENVKQAELGDLAGAIGAASLALNP